MKRFVMAFITVALLAGGIVFASKADGIYVMNGRGRIESGSGSIYDSRDFFAVYDALEQGKEASYNSGYGAGYQDGFSAKNASGAVSVSMVYHHNSLTGGETVTFTDEEVLNGTKDAWFAANPVPTYVSTPQGDYTSSHYTYIPAQQGCGYRFYGSFSGKCPLCGRQISVATRYNEDGTVGKNACPYWQGTPASNRFDGYTYTVPEGKLLQIVTNIN